MSIRQLRRDHAEAVRKAKLYPGYGWGKVAARLCRAIMEREAERMRRSLSQPEAA